jgi:pyruvate dehydrogenase E1 component
MLKKTPADIDALKILDDRLRFLSAWTIHHANHVRDSADGLKVGGHQASCADDRHHGRALFSCTRPNDRVVVKPHAGPVLHAIHYLLGSQSLEQLQNFRGFGGMQSYPSRTKDKIGRFLDWLGGSWRGNHRLRFGSGLSHCPRLMPRRIVAASSR